MLASGIAAAQHHHPTSPAAPDPRALVDFPPELQQHTLANMRDHLLALEQITIALSRGRNEEAARIAEDRLGMSSLPLYGADEAARFMPQGMQDAGTAMHHAASRFAIEATNAGVTGETRPAVAALGEVMSACNACHAGYRIR